MSFCECGGILVPTKNDSGNVEMRCHACGKIISADSSTEAFEIKQKIRHDSEREKMVVIDDADAVETMPTASERCEKCGHTKASYWQVQTRSGDEASTTFYRCKKCSFTWRDYG